MSLPNFPAAPAELAKLQVVRGLAVYKPSLRIQEFCYRWNSAARRAGLLLTIAVAITKQAHAMNAQVTLTDTGKAPQPGAPSPRRTSLSVWLPSWGPAPQGYARQLQSAAAVTERRSYLEDDARDVVTSGGSIPVAEIETASAAPAPSAPIAAPATDLDTVKVAVRALLQVEGYTLPFTTLVFGDKTKVKLTE